MSAELAHPEMTPQRLLKQLDDLGIANNTIVLYTTDNGAEEFSWPDGGTTPFHGEKNSSWEGGYRVHAMIRWPGVIKPGTEINGIVSHEDWVPTFVAAAGEPNVTQKLLTGYEAAIGYAARLAFRVLKEVYRVTGLSSATAKGRIPE
jgi:arylsulfatase A-like enzyme